MTDKKMQWKKQHYKPSATNNHVHDHTKNSSKNPRTLLDEKVQHMVDEQKDRDDIQPCFVIGAFLVFFLTTIGAVLKKNISYLTSQTAYVNGYSVHQYLTEVTQVKQFFASGITNFWLAGNSLGQPLLATSPLPTCLTALFMLLAERFLGISSLCFMRLFVLSLVMLLPVAWYHGCRQMSLTRTQSLFIGMSVLLCESQLQRGFELNEYLIEGNLCQLFAHLLFPLTVSKFYREEFSKDLSTTPFHMLCLMYLCSAFTGVYCSIIGILSHLAAQLIHNLRGHQWTLNIKRPVFMHVKLGFCLLWMIIPFLITYPYIGGEIQNLCGGFLLPDIGELFTSGFLFDFNQTHSYVTGLVFLGIFVGTVKMYFYVKCLGKSILQDNDGVFYYWIFTMAICTVLMYINNPFFTYMSKFMPLDLNCDSKLFIIGLQAFGVIFAGLALDKLANLPLMLPWFSTRCKHMVKFCLIIIITLILLDATADRVSEKTSILEVSSEFREAIEKVKSQENGNGRILTNTKLGTGTTWDIFNIPQQTGKPGAMSASNGWQDSLSVFYVDSIPFNGIDDIELKRLFRLYNIHYMAISRDFIESTMTIEQHFKTIANVDDIVFLKVIHDWPGSSYFEFAHLPGYINGNLKNIRETVVETLSLYASNILLYLNPRKATQTQNTAMLNIQVMKITPSNDVSLVTWKLNNQGMNSEKAIEEMRRFNNDDEYNDEEKKSTVIEELDNGIEYHALVEVADGDKSKVVLKVSYHPFWRCIYFPVNSDYKLASPPDIAFIPRNRTSALVDHVTPNFMSVMLPPGRYHVIFRYRHPGILKIMAVIFALVFVNGWLNLHLFTRTRNLLILVYGGIEMFQKHLLFTFVTFLNVLYYQSVDIDIEPVLRKFSLKSNLAYKPSRLRQFSSMVFWQCKDKLNSSRETLRKILNRRKNRKITVEKDENLKSSKVEKTKGTSPKKDQQSIKRSPERPSELILSDQDSSFSYDGLLYRSPPTPPKHTKKSYRKRHAKTHLNGGEYINQKTTLVSDINASGETETTKAKSEVLHNEMEIFQTSPGKSTSPRLGNIIKNLRRNSLSPDRDCDASPRIEKYVPRINLEEYFKRKASDRETLSPSLLKEFGSKPKESTRTERLADRVQKSPRRITISSEPVAESTRRDTVVSSGLKESPKAGNHAVNELSKADAIVSESSRKSPRSDTVVSNNAREFSRNQTNDIETTNDSPRRGTIVSEITNESPRRGTIVPDKNNDSPRRGTIVPEIANESPRRVTIIPETTNESPRRGTIIPETTNESPRRGTIIPKTTNESPRRGTIVPEIANESPKRGTIIPKKIKESPNRGAIVEELSMEFPRSPRKDTLVPDQIEQSVEHNTLEDQFAMSHYENNNYRKNKLNYDLLATDSRSPRSDCSEGAECEWDGMIFESNFRETSKPPFAGGSYNEIDQIVSNVGIDIEKGVDGDGEEDLNKSVNLSIEEESFSPRSSSSPEPSLSSPEQFSSSPDGHSSPDNSFEFVSGKNVKDTVSSSKDHSEHALNAEVYRIYIPDSPKDDANDFDKNRSQTIHHAAREQNFKFESPRRRTIDSSTIDESQRSLPHSPHQVRRKRYSIPLDH